MFITQSLDSDHSCSNAVKRLVFELPNIAEISENSAAYCKARKKLPEALLKESMQMVGKELHEKADNSWKFYGRPVKLIDGSTLSMPDTKANQEAYPQPLTQEKGIGFPLARIVAVICLSTGVVLDMAIGPQKGKKTGEHALLRELRSSFQANDIILGDRYYSSYWVIADCINRGIDVLFEAHASRKIDFKKGVQLGKKDHINIWEKPAKPEWMDAETYAEFPDNLEVREFKTGKKTLVTTLMHKKKFHKKILTELFYMRWNVEVDLRSIKTTMNLEILRCKTPEMIRKELWCGLTGYNIIRAMMAESAKQFKLNPRSLSFKGCLQTIHNACLAMVKLCEQTLKKILNSIASKIVGNRPDRMEPRAVKRRPKPYPRLDKPRAAYKMGA